MVILDPPGFVGHRERSRRVWRGRGPPVPRPGDCRIRLGRQTALIAVDVLPGFSRSQPSRHGSLWATAGDRCATMDP